MTSSGAARHLRARPDVLAGGGDIVDAAYASDTWDATVLGIAARRGRGVARFGVIASPGSGRAVKEWSRFRLGAGYSFRTIDAGCQSLRRRDHPDLTRELLERFVLWMAGSGWAVDTRAHTLTFVKVFLDWAHRHHTLPGLAANVVIYEEEVSRPTDQLPQFIPEFVMVQLESPVGLARIRNPSVRHLIIVLMETGIRGGDASVLAFNPMIEDSAGWPCLRFDNAKVGTEQLIPLSAKAAETIRAQQDHVRANWPHGSPWLFPGIMDNEDGAKPYAHGSLSQQLGDWQKVIDVRHEAGQRVRVHAHQFRHTVGTRLINAGVPQHVIQKLLGHASPRMTARYAQIHDHTVRDAFELYCHQRVDAAGDSVPYDPNALTADAEWPSTTSPGCATVSPTATAGGHPNRIARTPTPVSPCPDFQTTPKFLDVHRQQASVNRKLIARADANGQFRLADNLRRVQDSLGRIIPALEDLESQAGE